MSFHLITLGFLLRGQLAEFCPAFRKTGGIEHFTGYCRILFYFLIYPFLADTLHLSSLLLKILLQMRFFPDLLGEVINSDILVCFNALHKLAKNMCNCYTKCWFISSIFLHFYPFFFFSFCLFSTAQILAENFIMNLRLNFENKKCRLDSLQTTDTPLKLRLWDGLVSQPGQDFYFNLKLK